MPTAVWCVWTASHLVHRVVVARGVIIDRFLWNDPHQVVQRTACRGIRSLPERRCRPLARLAGQDERRVPESSASSAASSAALTLGTRRANCCTFVDDRLALRRAEPAVGPSASSSQQQSAAGWLRGLCPVAAGLARAIPTRLGPGARGPGGQAASAACCEGDEVARRPLS